MDGGCSTSSPTELSNGAALPDCGASVFLANLPSRGNFSSTVVSSNLGGTRVYICNHDTSPPEDQIIRTNQTNILIRSLMLMKQKGDSASRVPTHGSRKRCAEKALEDKAAGKRAMNSAQPGSSPDLQSLTVGRLRALLKERRLPITGRKDELIARLKSGANGNCKSYKIPSQH